MKTFVRRVCAYLCAMILMAAMVAAPAVAEELPTVKMALVYIAELSDLQKVRMLSM